jgi:cytoskeleton protein RodZ
MSQETIGQRLTRHRETMGLTTAAAAARLHCDESIIIALEADRFAAIGARVFVQGHLRRYADLIGAPTAELLADFGAESAALAAPDLTRIPRAPMPTVNSQAWARRLGIVAAAVVIAVAAWWILQGAGVSNSPIPAAEKISLTSEVDSTSVELPASGAELVAASAGGAASAITNETAVVETPVVEPPVAPTTPRVAGRVVLAIDVRADCWVEIYDAAGQKLYFDNVSRGAQARAVGDGPLRVLLGRADVASLQVGGRAVAIPSGFIRNSTAYFTVDAAANLQPFVKPAAPVVEPAR